MVRGYCWVEAGGSEEVQCYERVVYQSVPQVHREHGGKAGESRDEVGFERADGTFSGVGPMVIGGNQLELDVTGCKEPLERGRALVIRYV